MERSDERLMLSEGQCEDVERNSLIFGKGRAGTGRELKFKEFWWKCRVKTKA
jgi:hypothetical protein